MTEHSIGIDISKSHLDVFHLEKQTAKRFENCPQGFRALRKWLAQLAVTRVVFEATGPYHRGFEKAFSGRLPLVKVNPLQARRFAQACGTRVKTDAVDARLLARMGDALALVPDVPVSEKTHDLRDLQIARTALTKERTRLRNRGHVQTSAVLKRQTKARLVVRFRHLAPIFACPRPNVEISRTTSNYKFLVEFLNLTFARRDCGIWDTNVKFTPLARCHILARGASHPLRRSRHQGVNAPRRQL